MSKPAAKPAAKTDSRFSGKPGKYGMTSGRRSELLAGAVVASLLISALLTLDLLPFSSLGVSRIPQAGTISNRDYKAPASVSLRDPEATDALRREAIESAPAVYDFDERRADAFVQQIRAAFAAARAVPLEPPAIEGSTDSPQKDLREGLIKAFREGLGGEIALPEEVLSYLVGSGFSLEDEQRLERVLRPVLMRMTVADPVEFQRHAEKKAGILVRKLGSGEESKLTSTQGVLGLDSAREQVERTAEQVLADAPPVDRRALVSLAQALVRPNLSFNLRATDARRQAAEANVKEATITLRKGEIIVRDGDPITKRHVFILEGIFAQQQGRSRVEVFVGVAVLVLLLLGVLWRFGVHSLPRFPREPKDVWFLLSTLVVTALGTGFGLFVCDALADHPTIAPFVEQSHGILYYGLPLASATMLVRLVHNAETAALFAILISLVAGLQVRGEVEFAFYTLAGSLVAAVGAARVTQRGTLLRAGMRVAMANVLVLIALRLLDGQFQPTLVLISAGLGLVSGAVSGVLVSGLAPIVESVFSYTTDVKLLELANREQPLLRELEIRAPGTYHHSMMVGHLAEKAAEAIGANALLAKVAGYYHDIGKMRRPQFFVENAAALGGGNRHEKLAPSMSARIIQAHVKDGVELGLQHKLAPPIMQGIRQHHGTSIIRFFYEKAKEMADPDKGDLVPEHDYRYPGPRPQTREAGILMLADSVEAASRTLVDNSPPRVRQLVQRIINNYFRDGQLDECSLTLRDLNAIAKSFIDTLCAIRHERVDYPDPTDALGRPLAEAIEVEGVLEAGEGRPRERGKERREDGDLKRLGLTNKS